MSFFRKVVKDASKTTENLVGNMASSNAQNATNAAVDGMDLFRWKIGTPIIQNGKIAGAVTHVFVSDPTRGYGIFIENMLKYVE